MLVVIVSIFCVDFAEYAIAIPTKAPIKHAAKMANPIRQVLFLQFQNYLKKHKIVETDQAVK
jgi:hypothetical protein